MTSLFENPSRESYERETPEPVFAGERLLCCEYCDHPVDGDWCWRCEEFAEHLTSFGDPGSTKPAEKEPPKGVAEAEYPQPLKATPTPIFTPSTNRRARAGRLAS